MADRLAPRACKVCAREHGPGHVAGCYACGSREHHHHLVVVSRHGHQIGSVAACDVHSPPAGVLVCEPAGGTTAIAGRDPSKTVRDRAYRYATSVIRERYRTEFDAIYAETLGAASEGRAA